MSNLRHVLTCGSNGLRPRPSWKRRTFSDRRAPITRAHDVWEAISACNGATIDVRSPSEFAIDHIPGAINVPVLSDSEREIVGRLHNGQTFQARRVGASMIAKNIASALESDVLGAQPVEYQPLIYCWRGGQRSGALSHIMSQVGWKVQVLDGGYKMYRSEVRKVLDNAPSFVQWLVLGGKTGAGKTELLLRMKQQGHQVLDLEGHAKHRGSLLGHTDGTHSLTQPSQKKFETEIANALRSFDPDRPVWIESESSKIGNLHIPAVLWSRITSAPRVILRVPLEQRVQHTLDTYRYWTDKTSAQELERILHKLPHGRQWSAQLKQLADEGMWKDLVVRLLQDHYDVLYSKQLSRYAGHVRREICMEDLSHECFENSFLPAIKDMEIQITTAPV